MDERHTASLKPTNRKPVILGGPCQALAFWTFIFSSSLCIMHSYSMKESKQAVIDALTYCDTIPCTDLSHTLYWVR